MPNVLNYKRGKGESQKDFGYKTKYPVSPVGNNSKDFGYKTKYPASPVGGAQKDAGYKTRYIGRGAPSSPVGGSKNPGYATDYNRQYTGSSQEHGYRARYTAPHGKYAGKTQKAMGQAKSKTKMVSETGYMVINKGSRAMIPKIAPRPRRNQNFSD